MNTIDVIEEVRRHNAELVIDQDRLLVRGSGNRLPDDLRAAIKEHRSEIMIALGAPIDKAIAAILPEIRPHLPPSLRRLPDGDLLALVNWSIMAAWGKCVRSIQVGHDNRE